jgi:hypothetical protein
MIIETKGKGIELLNRALPYPEQMKNIDLDKEDAIYFTWRSSRYKLDLCYCRIDMVNGCLLEGNDASILMTQVLKAQLGTIM